MTEADILKIASANATNRYISQHLDGLTTMFILELMENLDANDFKEINPDGQFEFNDIPIPYGMLTKARTPKQEISEKVKNRMSEVLSLINENRTNLEFPFLLESSANSQEYSILLPFSSGGSQSCSYDWKMIEKKIAESEGRTKMSLLHTHPNPLGTKHQTLFNKYPEIMAKMGVKPDGLNISIADIYAQQYLEMLVEKYGKDIETESTILMHDGKLISFETKDGVKLTSQQEIEKVSFDKIIVVWFRKNLSIYYSGEK